ncbi:hypothetical protein RHMOL_Rhmol10G0138000 [Rhododendron molle]|uniref:Uncharacterized protein n=1 Tax=Rhododendron molle TaxID=49168 RepID=A0ACC0M1N5_RHOML|nr:hypothetical protein RHMOL_Rhmol10G0138000 [Rhododendron molle]
MMTLVMMTNITMMMDMVLMTDIVMMTDMIIMTNLTIIDWELTEKDVYEMIFDSNKDEEKFYNAYVKVKGFSI